MSAFWKGSGFKGLVVLLSRRKWERGKSTGGRWRARSCHHQAKWGLVRCHRLGHQVEGRRLGPDVIVIQPTAAVIDPGFFVIKIPSAEMVGMGQYSSSQTIPWTLESNDQPCDRLSAL